MFNMAVGKTALLVGATGLVGSELLQLLLTSNNYAHVRILVRNSVDIHHNKLGEHVINFDHLEQHADLFKVDDVFCCLGTTIKKAKSQTAFKKIDVDIPLQIAQLAREQHVNQFSIITAIGADATSTIFYSRMKGQLENSLRNLNFPVLHIFRPSLLLGDRKETRIGESLGTFFAKMFMFAFVGPLQKYTPISAQILASNMVNHSQQEKQGAHIYHYTEMDKNPFI